MGLPENYSSPLINMAAVLEISSFPLVNTATVLSHPIHYFYSYSCPYSYPTLPFYPGL